MKKTLLLLTAFCASQVIFGQNWVTPQNGLIYTPGPTTLVGINTSTPGFALDVAGTIHSYYGLIIDQPSVNGISAWIRSGSNVNGNLVLQGDVTSNSAWPAWWVSGGSGYLMIGTNGGSQPTKSPINIDLSGNIGINTLNTTGYKFNCAGTAVFDQVTVANFSGNNPKATPWADYVFDKTYHLLPLDSLSTFIKTNNHLPGIPTADEVQKNGIDLGATQAKLLEKIEQLTLYTIDLQNQADQSRMENEKLLKLLQAQSEQLKVMQQQIAKLINH